MLQLSEITKTYKTGDFVQHALDGVSVSFRNCEFAAVLGPSGSGKTTLLNIVGGLDQYDTGDLQINGKSTKKYKARDWDTYRNHSVGFVFQSYNLIPHQTVLANVELALTLSGVSKAERRKRALDVLEKVGLKEQAHKKPNQMSGGQMQRVAIARALINDPEILLADEPTGALDSETSVMIMDILKEVAKDRLVIMVTHNPELAHEYANRIITIKDGKVVDDTNPYKEEEAAIDLHEFRERIQKGEIKQTNKGKKKRTSMSFFTALGLSLNNLMTKKGRTILTAFAGSIGIIGIALILSVSSGVNDYIERVESDTLSSYPLTIRSETVDMSEMMSAMMGDSKNKKEHDKDAVYSADIMVNMMQLMTQQVKSNDLESFKKYIESEEHPFDSYVNDIKYSYDIQLNIFASDTSKGVQQVFPADLFGSMGYGENSGRGGMMSMMSYSIWTQLMENPELLASQYDLLSGKWPVNYDEMVLVVDENNELSDYVLYSLGLMDVAELQQMMMTIMTGGEIEPKTEATKYTYEEILNTTYKLVLNSDFYSKENGIWVDKSQNPEALKALVDDGVTLKIVGVVRPNEDAVASSIGGAIGYTRALTDYVINAVNASDIAKEQCADPTMNVLTGAPFTNMDLMDTYDVVAGRIGIVDLDKPTAISIYPSSFDSKDSIIKLIKDYNKKLKEEGKEEITYTDMVGLLMSSVTTIVNVISYALMAFVAISLIVSSIMIGIITYISVLERTKEIGILRAIGASKRDISRVFNAETMIVGFVAGAIGIGITLILLIPINAIIYKLSDIHNIAVLPVGGAIILVLISMFLTFIAGLIPARFASKRNPVEALRSE